MADRAQLDSGRNHWISWLLVTGLIVVLVLDEVFSSMEVKASDVEQVGCGLGCGMDPLAYTGMLAALLALMVAGVVAAQRFSNGGTAE